MKTGSNQRLFRSWISQPHRAKSQKSTRSEGRGFRQFLGELQHSGWLRGVEVRAREAWQMGRVQGGLMGKGMDSLAIDLSFC